MVCSLFFFSFFSVGRAQTQSPTTTNYAVEVPTSGEIKGVSTSGVQWKSLILGNHLHDHGVITPDR